MAREPFCPTPYPPFDGTEPLEVYRHKAARHLRDQRAAWLKEGPMASAMDAAGRPLYRFNARGNYARTQPIPSRTRREVLERDGHMCVGCGSTRELEIDHVVRYIDGGGNAPENLRTLCRPCHSKRGGQP